MYAGSYKIPGQRRSTRYNGDNLTCSHEYTYNGDNGQQGLVGGRRRYDAGYGVPLHRSASRSTRASTRTWLLSWSTQIQNQIALLLLLSALKTARINFCSRITTTTVTPTANPLRTLNCLKILVLIAQPARCQRGQISVTQNTHIRVIFVRSMPPSARIVLARTWTLLHFQSSPISVFQATRFCLLTLPLLYRHL